MPHHDPLRIADRIDESPRSYLDSVGSVFAIFGAATQDSGNVSYGVRIDGRRYFVKTTDPDSQVLLDWHSRVELLRNAVQIARDCNHRSLPSLLKVIESPAGPMLVYDGSMASCYVANAMTPRRHINAFVDCLWKRS